MAYVINYSAELRGVVPIGGRVVGTCGLHTGFVPQCALVRGETPEPGPSHRELRRWVLRGSFFASVCVAWGCEDPTSLSLWSGFPLPVCVCVCFSPVWGCTRARPHTMIPERVPPSLNLKELFVFVCLFVLSFLTFSLSSFLFSLLSLSLSACRPFLINLRKVILTQICGGYVHRGL